MSKCEKNEYSDGVVITAGSAYLDIDAYACCVALSELICMRGGNAIAYSYAPYNYSICKSLINEGQILKELPSEYQQEMVKYIIVDVSDSEYIKQTVPLHRVAEIYDHHTGFESYWKNCIGDNSHIEFIGAAATLIYREWKKAGLLEQMQSTTARLLFAAILDNTLNLTSANTTPEDIIVFNELCERESIGEEWIAAYFSEVQANVEADLQNALFNDIKTVRNNAVLPQRVGQLCVWDAGSILARVEELREWLAGDSDNWMVNIIDIQHRCSYFLCDDVCYQKEIERIFDVCFDSGIARTEIPYLRKEIIKKTLF